jgi:hypothetical protein
MFGRGTWAIVGLATESLEAFRTSLEERTVVAGFSQLAQSPSPGNSVPMRSGSILSALLVSMRCIQ